VKKGKLGFSRFYKVNLRLKAVGIWIALAPFIGNQRILTNARGNVWKQFTAKLLVIFPTVILKIQNFLQTLQRVKRFVTAATKCEAASILLASAD
jgi:hypothetical protein